ncbi:MAG TPA: vitamin K epoxide reductase family protein [Pyrinomonadaceae bacterium]
MTSPPDTALTTSTRRRTLLYALAALVSLIGLADAIYLTVEHLSGRSVRCTIVSGCSEVLSSEYATVRGIPLAMIGAAAYFTVFSLAVLAAYSYKWAAKLLTVVVGLMFVTTVWLLYLQAFVIKHFCQFCLLSALVTFILSMLVVISLRRD